MRVVALEEHFSSPELVSRLDKATITARGWPMPEARPPGMARERQMEEVSSDRLADMDEAGITLQVLSVSGPGADLLPAPDDVELARDYNDRLGGIVDSSPGRFAGFAHLPMARPDAAATELRRAVSGLGFCGALINGLTTGRFLDDPVFEPLLACAERLAVPLYLHPNIPPEPVRNAYYGGLPETIGFLLSTTGWGWHAEVALHVLRLVVSGTLERHPGLKLIVGHMGEGLPAMLTRCDNVFSEEMSRYTDRGLSRTILDQVWVTTSGFFTTPPFLAALTTFGVDRILFSVDYPYSSNKTAVDFLNNLPVSWSDREKIAHGNADRLLRLRAEPSGSKVGG